MPDKFSPTHVAIVPDPPRVKIVYYDPAIGHIAVAPADPIEREFDGRGGTLLQGNEKTPVAVFAGDAIVEYEEPKYVYAAMRRDDVSAWFKPLQSGAPALPSKSSAEKLDE